MLRAITLAVLFALGVMLAFEERLVVMLHAGTTTNVVASALTRFLRDHAPFALLRLEQEILTYLNLAPYAFMAGMFASIALGPHRALGGIVFWIGYALTSTILMVRYATQLESTPWYFLLPFAIGDSCTVPIYAMGVAVARFARRPNIPRCTLIDLMAVTAVFALLTFATIADSIWISPLVFFAISTGLAVRLCLAMSNAAMGGLAAAIDVARPLAEDELSSSPVDQ